MSTEDATIELSRLTEIIPEEVSLVDRAANKRRFLLRKDKGQSMTVEVTKDADGELSTQAPAVEEVAKAGISQTIKSEILQGLSSALEKAVEFINVLKEAPEPSEGDAGGLPDDFASELSTIVETVKALGDKYLAKPEAEAPADEAEVEKAESVEEPQAATQEETVETSLDLQTEVLQKMLEKLEAMSAPVSAPAESPKVADIEKTLEKVTGALGSLTKLVKAQGDELSKIVDGAGNSNAAPVEKSEEGRGSQVFWPTDFAAHVKNKQTAESKR